MELTSLVRLEVVSSRTQLPHGPEALVGSNFHCRSWIMRGHAHTADDLTGKSRTEPKTVERAAFKDCRTKVQPASDDPITAAKNTILDLVSHTSI